MLTSDEISALLSDLESDRVERTVSTTDTDKFARAVRAFANDMGYQRKPGVLIVGADDAGRPAGTPVTDELLQRLAALRSDGNIQPLPALQVYKVALEGGDVAVVEVLPSDMPPVRYKGRICIRVGPRRAEASEQEERILAERRGLFLATSDVHPVPDATLSTLKLRHFHDYRAAVIPAEIIEANHRSDEEQLAALRFFDLQRGVATVAGVLAFGQRPRTYMPGAYVQFLKFPGPHKSDLPVDQAEIDGDLYTVVEAMHARLRNYNTVGMTIDGFRDTLQPAYPEAAVRELLHNAIIHRDYGSTTPVRFYWYSDRIEIHSPGGLYGGLTQDLLTRRNAYRNPAVAETMKGLGYTNRFGYGLQRAVTLLAENGNPPLEFDVDNIVFGVTVRPSTH